MGRKKSAPVSAINENAAIAQHKTEGLTIAGCLEAILDNVSDPMADEDTDLSSEYDFVCGMLEITPVQAELLAAIIELGISGDATAENVARKLGCSNLKFISLRPEIDVLISRRYVRSSTSGYKGLTYRVSDDVIKQIQNNEKPCGEDISNLSTTGIMRRMNKLFRDFWRDSMDAKCLTAELFDLFKYNPDNTFVKEYTKRGIGEMMTCEQLLFLYMAVRRCAFHEGEFGWDDFGKLFIDDIEEDIVHSGIESGTLDLFENGIIEHVNNEGIVDTGKVCFVEEAINSILSDMCTGGEACDSNCRNLIGSSSIADKAMFYNSEEEKQIQTLTTLLRQDNFANVVSRLKEKGFRSGFSCLFHGPAGTGKTESVYQIARQTGRDIFLVDVAGIKSKWVGDSEKNIKALFQEYKRIVKNSELAPIMLFNEADAIFGVRKKGAEDSVDKMNNSIQNIILQEMESLEGIMIATTNLTQNFDPAFERRFIYKINFKKPDLKARTHIWESLVDGLKPGTAEILAKDFDFSGGQIENISRKATVGYILNGVEPDLEGLRELCENETLEGKKSARAKIGF